MTREEYDARRRRLDEELRAGLDLLQTGHTEKIRALNLLWTSGPGGPLSGEASIVAESRPQRRLPGQLDADARAALEHCPEVFEIRDLCRVLGYHPNRGNLYRLFQDLLTEGVISLEEKGGGRAGAKYRKL
jgi:hypothetical protein